MKIDIAYGKEGLQVDFDDRWDLTVIRKPRMPVVQDVPGAVKQAFENPIGSRTLKEEARGKRRVCILVCDITRPVPNSAFLGPMVREILDAGVKAENITLLIATGLHRPAPPEEIAQIVGDPWVVSAVKIENHYARRDEDHVYLGESSHGTKIKIDRRFVEADLRIATGLVESHLLAGWSGGRKVIAPGIAHEDTIRTFHNSRYVGHPKASNAVLRGNPLHEDQLDIVRMVGGALALNTVLDSSRRLSLVNFGEIVSSHLAAVEYLEGFSVIPFERRFNTIVSCNAGYPLDKTFYQACKGILVAMDIIEPGGNLILAAECEEGLGSDEFVEAQRRLVALGPARFLESIKDKRLADIDEWVSNLIARPLRTCDIHLYAGGLTPEHAALTGARPIRSVEAAVRASVEKFGDPRIAVLPDGPYVVPIYKPAHALA